jgi:pSer/pThr/pTyr-binding forkhead associated (FHA) protein
MDVALVMFKSDGSRREFPLQKSRVVVGRTSQCDLRIPLSSVSRQHCELCIEEDSLRMRDLGSSNGTFHNHTRVQEAQLEAGDEIVIGPVVFTVVVDGEPDITEPVRTMAHNGASGSTGAIVSNDRATDVPGPEAEVTDKETVDFDDPFSTLEAMAEETGDPDGSRPS